MEDQLLNGFATEVGCGVGRMPFMYLGLPIGANPRSSRFWAQIIERVEKRLTSWMRNYLSIGGRLTFIKSVLDNLCLYFASLFEISKWLEDRLERGSFYWEIRRIGRGFIL